MTTLRRKKTQSGSAHGGIRPCREQEVLGEKKAAALDHSTETDTPGRRDRAAADFTHGDLSLSEPLVMIDRPLPPSRRGKAKIW